jgi:hypothetical protein
VNIDLYLAADCVHRLETTTKSAVALVGDTDNAKSHKNHHPTDVSVVVYKHTKSANNQQLCNNDTEPTSETTILVVLAFSY